LSCYDRTLDFIVLYVFDVDVLRADPWHIQWREGFDSVRRSARFSLSQDVGSKHPWWTGDLSDWRQ